MSESQYLPLAELEFLTDLSLYVYGEDRFNTRQQDHALLRRQTEEVAVGLLVRDFNYRQRIRRAYLGPIAEPRQLGKKR